MSGTVGLADRPTPFNTARTPCFTHNIGTIVRRLLLPRLLPLLRWHRAADRPAISSLRDVAGAMAVVEFAITLRALLPNRYLRALPSQQEAALAAAREQLALAKDHRELIANQ